MIDKLGDRGQGKRVLDIDVVERHVLADHEGDGEVGGAPGGREESPLLRAQPLGLAEDGEICKAQIHCSGEASQARRGWSVLTHLRHKSVNLRKKLFFKQFILGPTLCCGKYLECTSAPVNRAYLFKDLRNGLVVCCDDCSVVVFEVFVDDGAAFSHREPRTSLPN